MVKEVPSMKGLELASKVSTSQPYFMGDEPKPNTVAEAEVAQPTPAQPAPDQASPENPTRANPTEAGTNPGQPDISPLGVDEEKTAPPNVNPLEGGNDNFLDGLE